MNIERVAKELCRKWLYGTAWSDGLVNDIAEALKTLEAEKDANVLNYAKLAEANMACKDEEISKLRKEIDDKNKTIVTAHKNIKEVIKERFGLRKSLDVAREALKPFANWDTTKEMYMPHDLISMTQRAKAALASLSGKE